MYKSLKIDYETLEPYISDNTLMLQYNNYYLTYLNKLNEILKKNNYNFNISKEKIYDDIEKFNIKDRDELLFNLGGAINHEIYFDNISDKKNNVPIKSIKKKINEDFNNYDNFKKEFIKKALELKSSGYTFLVLNKNNKLQIINMSNEENPYMYNLIPIIALDLYEHAYLMDYQSNKEKYIDAFFEVIDFNKINTRYEKIKQQLL